MIPLTLPPACLSVLSLSRVRLHAPAEKCDGTRRFGGGLRAGLALPKWLHSINELGTEPKVMREEQRRREEKNRNIHGLSFLTSHLALMSVSALGNNLVSLVSDFVSKNHFGNVCVMHSSCDRGLLRERRDKKRHSRLPLLKGRKRPKSSGILSSLFFSLSFSVVLFASGGRRSCFRVRGHS